MLHCVALVRTDILEKLSASIIRLTRISELGTTLAVSSNRRTLRRNTKYAFLDWRHSFWDSVWIVNCSVQVCMHYYRYLSKESCL
jgi:hypothetical protein